MACFGKRGHSSRHVCLLVTSDSIRVFPPSAACQLSLLSASAIKTVIVPGTGERAEKREVGLHFCNLRKGIATLLCLHVGARARACVFLCVRQPIRVGEQARCLCPFLLPDRSGCVAQAAVAGR